MYPASASGRVSNHELEKGGICGVVSREPCGDVVCWMLIWPLTRVGGDHSFQRQRPFWLGGHTDGALLDRWAFAAGCGLG